MICRPMLIYNDLMLNSLVVTGVRWGSLRLPIYPRTDLRINAGSSYFQ